MSEELTGWIALLWSGGGGLIMLITSFRRDKNERALGMLSGQMFVVGGFILLAILGIKP